MRCTPLIRLGLYFGFLDWHVDTVYADLPEWRAPFGHGDILLDPSIINGSCKVVETVPDH